MPQKPKPEESNSFFDFLKKIWGPAAGLIGAVILINQLIQLWRGDAKTTTVLLAIVGLGLWFAFLLWVRFGKKQSKNRRQPYIYNFRTRRISQFTLIGSVIGLIILGIVWQTQQRKMTSELENQVVVVIARFDGPEETYGLRDQILEELTSSLSGFGEIRIIPVDESVTIAQGKDFAQEIAKNYQADLIIWGWYRPTENPNLTLHIENLAFAKFSVLSESATYKPQASIAELESFSLQQTIGEETSAIVSFVSGLVFYESKDYENALKRFQQALRQQSSTVNFVNQAGMYFYVADTEFQLNNYQQAIIDYSKAIQLNSELAPAYDNRGAVYSMIGQYAEAISDFERTMQLDPLDAGPYVNRGIVYMNQGQYELALQDFDRAVEIDPQKIISKLSYQGRGEVYFRQGQYDKAITEFSKAIDIDPHFESAYYDRGAAYLNQDQYQKAIADFNQVLMVNPDNGDAYTSRGKAYFSQQLYEQAIIDFNHAIDINPQDAEAYYYRGKTYYFQEQYEQAIADFNKAIELDPQNANAFGYRGNTYYKQKQYEQAIADYDKAIEIDPREALQYYNRGLAYQSLGKQKEADADFAKYKELSE